MTKSMSEHCDKCGDETMTPYYLPDGRALCPDCYAYETTMEGVRNES